VNHIYRRLNLFCDKKEIGSDLYLITCDVRTDNPCIQVHDTFVSKVIAVFLQKASGLKHSAQKCIVCQTCFY
jgi:hypothetical protein